MAASAPYQPSTIAGAEEVSVARSRLEILSQLQSLLLAAVVVLAPVIIYVIFVGSMSDMAADHRLAPSFAIAKGYQLYYPADHGPVLSTIYGPVTALVYLPATLASSPLGATFIATILMLAMFYFGSIVAVKEAAGTTWLKIWELLAVIVAATWLFPPVHRAASSIHADAPALAFGAIAAAFAMREKWRISRWENEVLAGVCCASSVFAKQNMAPLVVGLALWMLLRTRWKGLAIFAAAAATCSALLMGLIAARLGGVSAYFFNCIYLPLHQPYDKALLFPAMSQLLTLSLAILALPVFRLLQSWAKSDDGHLEFLLSRKTTLLLLIGVVLIPTSIMGRLKFGAIESALSPTLYFFVLALIAELFGARATRQESGEMKLAVIPVLLACVIGATPAVYLAAKARVANPAQQVYEYCRSNPGKVYFPQFPLAQLMAEGKLYHFAWGLTDRRAAGVPITDEHFAANIPAGASAMAIVSWVPMWDQEAAARHGKPINVDGAAQLREFEFYAMNAAARR